MPLLNRSALVKTQGVFKENRTGRGGEQDLIGLGIDFEDILVGIPALVMDPFANGVVGTFYKSMRSIFRAHLREADENLQPPDPVQVKMVQLG